MRPYLIVICEVCEHRQARCSGFCPCTIDGRHIIDHATSGDCPIGKYDGITPDSPPPAPPPIPRHLWPQWATWLELQAQDDDKGIGDTAAREIARLGLDGFQSEYGKNGQIIGKECGCPAREFNEITQQKWNALYPYK